MSPNQKCSHTQEETVIETLLLPEVVFVGVDRKI